MQKSIYLHKLEFVSFEQSCLGVQSVKILYSKT